MKSKRAGIDNTNYAENRRETFGKRVVRFILRVMISVLVVAVLSVAALLTAVWAITKGPSPTAQSLFVNTVMETNSYGFLAGIFLSEEEVDSIMNPPGLVAADTSAQTDSSLITIKPPETQIQLEEISGSNYKGYILIVDDPTRVFVATPGSFGGSGFTVAEHIIRSIAYAGINGGGFISTQGRDIPEGIVLSDGVFTQGGESDKSCVVGFDKQGILHIGNFSFDETQAIGISEAVTYSPALIINGVPQNLPPSGLIPRTAIGQRADGTVLMLVIDGWRFDSAGATLSDITDILLDYGAVNAGNLTGGSSSQMNLNGDEVNRGPQFLQPRRMPTAFLIRRADNE